MLPNMRRMVRACGTLCLVALSSSASAQWYSASNSCGCVQQVVQPCYQTVPVTEYREVTQTVRRPIYETKYVEQPVTEYHPVVEQRTVEVPTVQYQSVTELHEVPRDASYWMTSYQPNPKMSPCQYDPRPGMLGWLNRTGYSIRQSFTPNYIAQRHYVPQQVVQQVPVTRQVAIRGSRQVTYNVTRMEPRQTTRRVAVRTVRYQDEQVTAMRPVTVMRSVPIGTSVAYAFSPLGATQTTLLPLPDSIGGTRSASRDEESDRTARSSEPFGEDEETVIPGRKYRRGVDSSERDRDFRRSSYSVPQSQPRTQPGPTARRQGPLNSPSVVERTNPVPSIVRVSGWTARSQRSRGSVDGPTLASPALSVADNSR